MNEILRAIRKELKENVRPQNEKKISFFKTGKGQYAENDQFLDVKVSIVRKMAKEHKDMKREDLQSLMNSPFNEERLLALFILIDQYKKTKTPQLKEDLYQFYVKNLTRVNNWNLVDTSAHLILGEHLLGRDKSSLLALIKSSDLWERRVAMVATWQFIRAGEFQWTVKLAEELLEEKENLMHKASGWMLREVGKRDEKILRDFLDKWAHAMPRTMLRYAIEKLTPEERQYYREAKWQKELNLSFPRYL